MSNINHELLQFLEQSPTCFQAIENIRTSLLNEQYTELNEGEIWNLVPGEKYFTVRNESSIIAFRIPTEKPVGFMITASHSDSPTFKIKENPEIYANGYTKLNVEKYGGMLMGPWLDRPLSVAGRVIVKNGDRFETKSVVIDDDLILIPNLAIHMNRKANENQSWNAQVDLLPILGTDKDKPSLLQIVADYMHIEKDSIISHDLFLYVREKGRIWGAKKEFLSCGRLDDLQCTYANVRGFIESETGHSIPLLAVFDNEEVGSGTKQGADSTFLNDVIDRISIALNVSSQEKYTLISNSFMISADNAHALHPNHSEIADPVNRPQMNQGIVIKYNANQKYTTDAVSAAVFKTICNEVQVPTQTFTNRSDTLGGSTLGNISNAHVSLNTVDIGLAQLAMHSPYETAGTKDTEYLITALRHFYSLSFRNLGNGSWKLEK